MSHINNIIVLDQVEVQRWPGRGPPTARLVVRLLGWAGLLRPLQPVRVLDLTYGQGVWWLGLPQAVVAAFDARRLEWRRRPRCFIQAPAQHWQHYASEIEECLGGSPPDLVAVDPPWQQHRRGREPGGRTYYRATAAIGSPEQILQAGAEAAAHWGVPLLVHYATRWLPPGFIPAVEAYWRPWFYVMNPRAEGYRSWWAVLRPVIMFGLHREAVSTFGPHPRFHASDSGAYGLNYKYKWRPILGCRAPNTPGCAARAVHRQLARTPQPLLSRSIEEFFGLAGVVRGG